MDALASQEACFNHSTDSVCPDILFFQNGYPSTTIADGLDTSSDGLESKVDIHKVYEIS